MEERPGFFNENRHSATPSQKKPAYWTLLVGPAFLLGGAVMIVTSLYVLLDWGTTAEEDLTLAEGVATDIEVRQSRIRNDDRHYLYFTVAGYRTEYASYQRNFAALRRAVESGQPMQIWVSTKQETVFPRNGWVPLYKASIRGEPILTYAEVVAEKKAGPVGGPITILVLGCVGVVGGVYLIYVTIREIRRVGMAAALILEPVAPLSVVPTEPRPAKTVGPEADYWKRVTWMTVAMSVVVYSILPLLMLEPKVQARMVEVFGPAPLGYPVLLVVLVAGTLLYVPIPWFFWHSSRLALQVFDDRKNPGFVYLLTVGFYHPHLLRSQIISIAGVLYAISIAVAWFVYLTILGL